MSIKATPGFQADNDTGDFCLITPDPTIPNVSGEDAAHHLIVDDVPCDPPAFSPGVNPACRSTMLPTMPEAVDNDPHESAIQSNNKVHGKPDPAEESMMLFLLDNNRKLKQKLATLQESRESQPRDRAVQLQGEHSCCPRAPTARLVDKKVLQLLSDAHATEKTSPGVFEEPPLIPSAPEEPPETPEQPTPEKPISNARHYSEATQLWNAIHNVCDLLEASRKPSKEKSKSACPPDCGGPVPPEADFQDPFAAIDPMPPHDVLDDFDFDAYVAGLKVQPEEVEFGNSKFSALCAVQELERRFGVGGKGGSKPKKGKKKVGGKVVGGKKKDVKTLRRRAANAMGAFGEKMSLENLSGLCVFGILFVFVVIAFQLSAIAGLMTQDHKTARSWW